jgi:signal transduction histidine kinase/ActR/RegA family two-component response regulator
MSEVLGEAAYERLKPHVNAALQGQREAFEAEIPYKDGGIRFIHAEYVPDEDRDNVVRGFYVLVTDITQTKRAELALRAAKESVEAANIAKDNFLATLSHELRTPLTPVMAALGSWEARGDIPEDLRPDLAMICRNLELEARLIDDLLDLTRIVKGKMEINLEVLDLNKLIDSVVGMYRSEINAKKLDIDLQLDATNSHIRGDPGRLQQVFWNLLKNAVKFTPEGGRIDVATRNVAPGRLQITVADTGVGMPAEFLDNLFTPFAQGHVDSVKRYGGLGLGLAISRKLLEAHGGTIDAKSDGPGQGSMFTIHLEHVEPTDKTEPIGPASSGRQSPEPEKRIRILLIEDHEDTARVMVRLLGLNGHEVRRAKSVAEAIAAMDEAQCDVLISDIGLPDGTGIDLIKHVRLHHGDRIPAVAMTGYGMEEDVARCTDAGFGFHLTKPINFARLEETIQRACAAEAKINGPA